MRREYTAEQYAHIRQMARAASDARREVWARRFPVAPIAGPVRVVLIGCVAEKAAERCAARDLYRSPLFRFRRAYAERTAPERWLILSAYADLVHPTEVLPPYDRRLSDLRVAEREAWAERVVSGLRGFGYAPWHRLVVELHAGSDYRERVVSMLRRHGAEVLEPLAGLGIGQQLGWYRRRLAGEQLALWA